MANFYLINRMSKGSRSHTLAWKFSTPAQVAAFLKLRATLSPGTKRGDWIIVKNGKGMVLDRCIGPEYVLDAQGPQEGLRAGVMGPSVPENAETCKPGG